MNFILRWDKAHTKSAALYTGVTETEATPRSAPNPGAAHIGNPMQLKNPILGLCQQNQVWLPAKHQSQAVTKNFMIVCDYNFVKTQSRLILLMNLASS